MTQNYDELLSALSNDDRYSQGACSKCAKGFENHEYHCFGPETEGCIVSQKELHSTVLQWKKERTQAAEAIRELQAENATIYNQAIEGAVTVYRNGSMCETADGWDWFSDATTAIRELKRPTP